MMGSATLTDLDREKLVGLIVEAGRQYRDAMRLYLSEQSAMYDHGVPVDELVATNWKRYAEAQEAETDLFALLDALDAHDRQSQPRQAIV